MNLLKTPLVCLPLLFSSTVFAANDCQTAKPMASPVIHLTVQALRLHKANASYQEIAEWRTNTFNPEIEKIIEANTLPPSACMDPDLEITRDVYNDVMMRSKIYVNMVYSYARGNADKESVDEQRIMISDAYNKYVEKCTTK